MKALWVLALVCALGGCARPTPPTGLTWAFMATPKAYPPLAAYTADRPTCEAMRSEIRSAPVGECQQVVVSRDDSADSIYWVFGRSFFAVGARNREACAKYRDGLIRGSGTSFSAGFWSGFFSASSECQPVAIRGLTAWP
jgi:hypothetical protein